MLREQKAELEHKEYMLKEREIKCREEEGAFLRLKEEHSKLKKRFDELSRKLTDTEEILKEKHIELSTISNAARRAQEALNNMEAENKILREKLNMIEKAYEEERAQSEERRNEYNENVAKLREELKQYKQDLSRLKEHYKSAEKERAEVAAYKLSQAKASYEDVIAKKDQRLRSLKHNLEDERAFNEAVPSKYRTEGFLQRRDEEDLSSSASVLNDSEYLAQKDRWAQLDRETEMVKSNIRTVLAPSDPLGVGALQERGKVKEDPLSYDKEVIRKYSLPPAEEQAPDDKGEIAPGKKREKIKAHLEKPKEALPEEHVEDLNESKIDI
eukprot:TRINITY_DN17067_c0_g1_i1.p2 TRINITY_DN17067_c0_g1~~TRINITY_DN17067_c0_g1_i1.p2  ORF type:complete len:328 (+),score=114.23 TRINITY_DN17067_c0_g1_i1:1217-2200(+)